MNRLALPFVLLISACTTYSPQPLPLAHSILIEPLAAVLEQKASTIERPWLNPVYVDLSAPLSLDAVAALAVVNNPDLAAQRTRAGVAGAQVFAAGLLPDPTFSIGASQVLSGPDTMLDLTAGIGLDIASLRTRAVRRAVAVAQERQVRLDLAWAEWQLAGQARVEATRITRLKRIVALAQASRQSTQSLLDRITRAAARGDIGGDRLQSTRLAVLSASETLRLSQRDLAIARVELTRQLGLPPEFILRLAEPTPIEPPLSVDALFGLAQVNRTDLAALREGYTAQEATVRLAVLEQFPNLGITLNTQRDSAGNFLAGPAVDLTLPIWNRNRGAIAVELATREALRAEFDARLFKTRADIAAAEAGIAVAVERRADALNALPELERYAAASRSAADRGDLSRETADNTEQALRDRQIQLAQAELDIAEQMIALEMLSGTPQEAWPR